MGLPHLTREASRLYLLKDETCIRAWEGAFHGSLILDFGSFGEPDQTGYREPDLSLVLECPWRLETRNNVIVGSGDGSETIESTIQTCVGARIADTIVETPSYSARIIFACGMILSMFPSKSSYYDESREYASVPWYVTGSLIEE